MNRLALFSLLLATSLHAGTPPTCVTSSFLGTSGDDDLQGVAAAPDGSILVVGNAGQPMTNLPGGINPARFGADQLTPLCGHGFVARLSPDGRKVLHYAEFAAGNVILTSVQANDRAVYVSGYASFALAPLIAGKGGLIPDYPLIADPVAASAPTKPDPLAGRPGLGRLGAPFVLRLSPDLSKIEAGTYLEGWQQVWDKKRFAKQGREMLGGYLEYFWQPTSLALLPSGDVIVCHDGGYFRKLTEADTPGPDAHPKMLEYLEFYDVPDYLSRLSPDLAKRAWQTEIRTPISSNAATVKTGWPHPYFGNPRTQRIRLDQKDNLYVAGWSASLTSKEPWWSPFLWKVDVKTGQPIWRAYEYDPMSGGDHRMGGTVADTALLTVTPAADGTVLTSLLSDGGNTVMGQSPLADGTRFEGPIKEQVGVKLVHWWGRLHRIDGETRKGLAGTSVGPWAWAVDLADFGPSGVAAAGRYNGSFDFSADAWNSTSPVENPNMFLRLYSPGFDRAWSTSVPGVVPFEMIRTAQNRAVIVGRAEGGVSPTHEAIAAKSDGGTDGYFLVFDLPAQ